MNGSFVDPDATAAERMISTRPMTDISDVSFSVSCQTLPMPGNAKRATCGTSIRQKRLAVVMPTAFAASIWPAGTASTAPRMTSVL